MYSTDYLNKHKFENVSLLFKKSIKIKLMDFVNFIGIPN